jgi:hypothetical protein
VRPGSRVPYVPTAALVVRRAALPSPPFDPDLRYGEDVDLVWRLHDRGWSVRYDPRTVVRHAEPDRWRAWLARRHHHGTSAAPLADRHGDRLTPLVLPALPTLAWAGLLSRRPGAAAAAVGLAVLRLHRQLRSTGLERAACRRTAVRVTGQAVLGAATGAGGAGTVVTGPLLRRCSCTDARAPPRLWPSSSRRWWSTCAGGPRSTPCAGPRCGCSTTWPTPAASGAAAGPRARLRRWSPRRSRPR